MMRKGEEKDIPILTDVVELRAAKEVTSVVHTDEELAALQADLVGRALNLTDELLHSATREMEGVLFERVLDRLRAALPEIVSAALREHLSPRED